MRDPSANRTEARAKRLDEWLDDALDDTFPASDPVATPPAPERGDRGQPLDDRAMPSSDQSQVKS